MNVATSSLFSQLLSLMDRNRFAKLVTVAQQLKLPKGSLLVMDRGYNDYRLFDRWTTEGVGFVTRLKKNALWTSREERPVKSGGKVLRDTVGRFFDFDASRRI